MKTNDLYRIAIKNNLNVEKANNFNEAIKKISSKEKKIMFVSARFIMLEIF